MHHLRIHNPEHHPLTRIDPRVKLLCALAVLVLVISSGGFLFPLAVTGLSLGLCRWLRVRPRQLLVRFAEPAFIAAMIILLKLFFSGTVPLFSWSVGTFIVTGHADGLREGLLIASRVAAAVSAVSVVGFATSFTEIMAALAWLRIPRGLVDVALFAWRYLFVLFEDATVVYSAQKNRLGYAGFRRGLSSFGTLAGTLVIKAFDGSQSMTTAMVQRGYDGTLPLLSHEPLRLREVAGGVIVTAAMVLVWIY